MNYPVVVTDLKGIVRHAEVIHRQKVRQIDGGEGTSLSEISRGAKIPRARLPW
jgi:hypothetical protein